jgi:2-polyprenyl-3-methyl-5-hydroxy-6-metoxy-1,4-benzoquinol methylase
VSDQPLDDLRARLERERQAADRRYNDALTVLDGAIQALPVLPDPPASIDGATVRRLGERVDILQGAAPPPDQSLKGRLRRFIWAIVGPPLEAQRQFNALVVEQASRQNEAERRLADVVGALRDVVKRELDALVRFESLLVQYLQTITAYVDTKDRAIAGHDLAGRLALAEARVMALKREMDARSGGEPGGAASDPRPSGGRVDSVTYVGFEDRFRGSRSDIRGRLDVYLPLLQSARDVLDVGCGRGELLGLLRSQGVSARGVDANPAMVALCRAEGFDVEESDALSYLERQGDGTVGGLIAIQVVEHFEPGYLGRFLDAAFHKLRPGSPLVLETINPACWMAFFECYIRDLTHQRPLHPDTLRYLVEASGFGGVDVHFRQPVSEADRLPHVSVPSAGAGGTAVAELATALNAHADRLNARLFSSMDYAVVARR